MNQSQTSTLLLRDALDQVFVNPTASPCWHRLTEFYREADHDLRAVARELLIKHAPAEGVAGFFRATFLAGWTADPEFIEEAARIAQAIEPLDAGRLITFMAIEWGRATRVPNDRAGFIRALRHARLPGITDQLGQHLSNSTAVRPVSRDITRVNNVALIVPYISNANHTPTSMALNQAQLLIEQGLRVHLFACQELKVPRMAHYQGDGGELLIASPDLGELGALLPPGLAVTLSDERFCLTRRWADMLQSIATFDPDVVLFNGLFSPLVAPLYEARPVLGLSIHSVPPIAPVDVWLTAHQELGNQGSSVWGPDLPDAWGYYHPYRIALKPTGTRLARNDIGLPAYARVLVTAGHRLVHEIHGEWAARMMELLRQHPDAVWLLVGGGGTLPPALENAPQHQLRILPTHADLRTLYRCCDIYVNPPRMGGGFSVAEAMAESLPVVTYGDSDGGQKVGSAAASGEDDYFAALLSLMRDDGLRQRAGAAMQARFSNALDVWQSGPSLVAACQVTLDRYRQRTSCTLS
jgi:hypothetical protein